MFGATWVYVFLVTGMVMWAGIWFQHPLAIQVALHQTSSLNNAWFIGKLASYHISRLYDKSQKVDLLPPYPDATNLNLLPLV